jgi:hypothetical protein
MAVLHLLAARTGGGLLVKTDMPCPYRSRKYYFCVARDDGRPGVIYVVLK